jgi:hypothetical protein
VPFLLEIENDKETKHYKITESNISTVKRYRVSNLRQWLSDYLQYRHMQFSVGFVKYLVILLFCVWLLNCSMLW